MLSQVSKLLVQMNKSLLFVTIPLKLSYLMKIEIILSSYFYSKYVHLLKYKRFSY